MLINGVELKLEPGANLDGADLRGADLREANLDGANLSRTNLSRTNLDGANLSRANLREANLYQANLREANLYQASLDGADLDGANLARANLVGANLDGANLFQADLREADLREANLYEANLYGAKNIPAYVDAVTRIVPEGLLIGYKKLGNGQICKLEIPADARRSNATGRKCRAEYAIVLEGSGFSKYDPSIEYGTGAIVHAHEWCEDRWQECAGGIHFFLTRYEAENY